MEEGSPGSAELVWTGDSRTVHAHQEHQLRQAQGCGQLPVHPVEHLVLQPEGGEGREGREGEGGREGERGKGREGREGEGGREGKGREGGKGGEGN